MVDHVVVEPDHGGFARVVRALHEEADGTQWAAELAADLHDALEPGVAAARGVVLGMPSAGLPHAGESLRVAVAHQVVSEVNLGRSPGARIRVRKRGMPRNFRNAAKRLNARRGWRHPVYGHTDVWVAQRGEPGWFDDTMRRLHPRLRQTAERALERRARRITRRV